MKPSCSVLSRLSLCLIVFFFCALVALAAQTKNDVDAKDNLGQTALIRASEKRDTAAVIALVHAGADVNAADNTGQTALLAASAFGGKLETVQALIQGGADLNATDLHPGRTPLMFTGDFGGTEVAQALIKAGADLNITDHAGRTALMHAISSGHSEIVEALIKAGANLNQTTEEQASPLMLAAWACNPDMVRNLMKAGATVGPQEWMQKRPPQFDDFPVTKIYRGPQRPVDLHSNPQAMTYRTRLREGARHKPNFAGHYIAVDWGCGSNCQSYMLIDAVSGKVFNGTGTERGLNFRLDSSLAIADPPDGPDSVAYPDDVVPTLPVRYLLWKHDKFITIDVETCSVKDSRQKCGCEEVRDLLRQPKPK